MKTYHYKLEDIFFGAVTDEGIKRKCCLYKVYIKGITYYREISDDQHRIFNGDALSYENVTIYSSLVEFAKEQEISLLLKNKSMKLLDVVTLDEIKRVMKAAKTKKKLGEFGYKELINNCNNAADYICDLLGFNILTHPITTYVDGNKAGLEDIPIPARRLVAFRRNLSIVLAINLLFNDSVIIFKNELEMDDILKMVVDISKIEFTPSFIANCMSLQIFKTSFELKKHLFPNKGTVINRTDRMAMLMRG